MTDLCNLPAKPNASTNNVPLDGHSIKPLLLNPEKGQWDGPEVALTVVANGNKHPREDEIVPAKHHYAVRSKRYRYILCNNGEEELYDHQKDPYEWDNLTQDPKYSEIKNKLRKELFQLTGRND